MKRALYFIGGSMAKVKSETLQGEQTDLKADAGQSEKKEKQTEVSITTVKKVKFLATYAGPHGTYVENGVYEISAVLYKNLLAAAVVADV